MDDKKNTALHPVGAITVRQQIDQLSRDPDYRKALKAITDLAQAPSKNDSALLMGRVIAALAATRNMPNAPISRKALQEIWADGTGKSWKALTDFPQQIERMADEVEKLNAHSAFAPARLFAEATAHWTEDLRRFTYACYGVRDGADAIARWMEDLKCRVDCSTIPADPDTSWSKTLSRRSEQLPTIMRFYAEALKERIARTLRSIVIVRTQGQAKMRLVALSAFVREVTGDYHDEKAAELLNAAWVALNPGAESEPVFNAQMLAQARYRRKK